MGEVTTGEHGANLYKIPDATIPLISVLATGAGCVCVAMWMIFVMGFGSSSDLTYKSTAKKAGFTACFFHLNWTLRPG